MSQEYVALTVPAKVEYLVTVRLVAGALAGQAGFDVDDIEDTKTACSEACLLLIAKAKGEIRIKLWIDDGIYASISAPINTSIKDSPESEIGMFLLEALADEVEFCMRDDVGVYDLFKRQLDA